MRRRTLPPPCLSDLPRAWQSSLAGFTCSFQTTGRSQATAFRLEATGRPTLYLKTELSGPFSELPWEVARLRWLAENGIACPRVLAATQEGGREWLMMTAVAGHDLAAPPNREPAQIVEIAAEALRHLHQLDISHCPFDHRREVRIAQAHARLKAGLVDEDDFDEDHLGRSAAELFEELELESACREELVVTHGDACLSNLLTEGARFSGFIDCGRLGRADLHQDLALMARSIHYELGEEWERAFLRCYGGAVDPERLAFYRLLDEFF